ncbi:hypothetical protein HanRHA438_Chr12g0532661 [Helianthus annuus]|nr:hypothetical protein HanRHA438_Chr12g0532661 [Helianthus annuus]
MRVLITDGLPLLSNCLDFNFSVVQSCNYLCLPCWGCTHKRVVKVKKKQKAWYLEDAKQSCVQPKTCLDYRSYGGN